MGTMHVGTWERVRGGVQVPVVSDVLSSSPVASLADYYRVNGESEFLRRVEAALTNGWAATWDVAATAGVSPGFARKGLEYLLEEGRAEKRLMGKRWKWRSPSTL